MNMITKLENYDVMFAARTGVTILLPKSDFFADDSGKVFFAPSAENDADLVLFAGGGAQAVLSGLKKDYMDEILDRGFLMFYEVIEDEVVRCTAAHRQE